MPLEGSAFEELVKLTDRFNEDALGELVEKLGKDRTVTADEMRAAITLAPVDSKGLPVGMRRRRFLELLGEKNLELHRPGPRAPCRGPCRRYGRFRGIGPRVPLPGSRHARPP